jgi:hypothetical protein
MVGRYGLNRKRLRDMSYLIARVMDKRNYHEKAYRKAQNELEVILEKLKNHEAKYRQAEVELSYLRGKQNEILEENPKDRQIFVRSQRAMRNCRNAKSARKNGGSNVTDD